MSNEVITALIEGIVVLACGFLTFIPAMKKIKNEQIAQLDAFKAEMRQTMSDVQDNYAKSLAEILGQVSDLKASYQQSMAVIQLQISNLEKKQDLHNGLVERTYKLEEQVAVLDNREKVSENRLSNIERHEEDK